MSPEGRSTYICYFEFSCKEDVSFFFFFSSNLRIYSTIYLSWYFYLKHYHRARTNTFTICMEIQKTSNSQSNLEKEEWNLTKQPAWLQSLLQSHSHQDSMVQAQREKYRPMKQNRKPRDKSTHLQTTYLWQRKQKYTIEKTTV